MRGHLIIGVLLLAMFSPIASVSAQPDIIEEHWYHQYITLTNQINQWEADYPDKVKVVSAGQTELGREQWVVQISNWSRDTAPDGKAKTIVYIDGGHHGNEHLGTELAFLVAEFYIEESTTEYLMSVLDRTEIHVMVMLNADGNDLDTRWNINQIDLNRNYDHMWSEEETQSGRGGPFSEAETANNRDYMNDYVADADLYVTMHTGVWILAYPWGYTPDMPSDWEMYTYIADYINENISEDLPVKNANSGIYPTHGTSRDYGYGIMGFPTFTFETDDEQFLPGTVESLSSRLGEELDVMEFLIEHAYEWRALLEVDELLIDGKDIELAVNNRGRASTQNATLQYLSGEGEVLWTSANFSVNATFFSEVTLDASDLKQTSDGQWQLNYQVRVVESSRFVSEAVNDSVVKTVEPGDDSGFLPGFGIFNAVSVVIGLSLAAIAVRLEEE